MKAAIRRVFGAVLLEQNDEWQLQHRYMQVEAMAELAAAASAIDPRSHAPPEPYQAIHCGIEGMDGEIAAQSASRRSLLAAALTADHVLQRPRR